MTLGGGGGIVGHGIIKALDHDQETAANASDAKAARTALDKAELRELERAELYEAAPSKPDDAAPSHPAAKPASPHRSLIDRLLGR